LPYQSGTRLPGESASKLGHLAVVENPWVKALVESFDSAASAVDAGDTSWTTYDPEGAEPLARVWAVDGSFVRVCTQEKPPREVAFVKTALMTVDRARLAKIDKEYPHPLELRDVMSGSGFFHSTAFPLKNVRTPLGNNYDSVRNIVYESIRQDQEGAFYETFKWLAYQRWRPIASPSPRFDRLSRNYSL